MTSHSTTATNQTAKTMPIIVLTAGHGGKDMGAVNANYQGKTHTESSIACEMECLERLTIGKIVYDTQFTFYQTLQNRPFAIYRAKTNVFKAL